MNAGPFIFTPSHQGPPAACPYCGAEIDGYTGVTGDEIPDPGDPSVCVYCAGLLVFDLDRLPREPREDELPALLADPTVMTMQRAVREMKFRGRRGL